MREIRRARGKRAFSRGLDAESAVCSALERDGWAVLARRLRTKAGEIDIVAEKDGLLAIIEVKARRTLAEAAFALTEKQRARLIAATDILLAEHPEWGSAGVRFDILVVEAAGRVRRIAGAFHNDT